MTATSSMYEHAQEYARQGFPDFPCHGVQLDVSLESLPSATDGLPAPKYVCTCGESTCPNPGKHPWCANGLKDATTDPVQIKKWSRKWKAGANIAIRGGDGLLIVDVDSRKDGADDTLAALEREYGLLPRDWVVKTGGGIHIYVSLPPGVEVRSVNNWRPGIDLKSRGGYVIAPPSRHQSGALYEWLSKTGNLPPLVSDRWLQILPVIAEQRPRPAKLNRPERAGNTEYIQSVPTNPYNSVNTLYGSEGEEESRDTRSFIEETVTDCVLREKDTHNDERMRLARTLKSCRELREVDGESLAGAYRNWFDRSLPKMAEEHQCWERSLGQWIQLWDWVEKDVTQEAPYVAFLKAQTRPLPAAATKYKSSTKRLLLAWCAQLQQDEPDEHDTFYLANRKAAEPLEITKEVICAWMKDFVRDGLLVKVCRLCWSEGTIVVERVGNKCVSRCTACNKDPVAGHHAMRYRYRGDDVNVVESTAA